EAIGAWNPLLPKDGERVKVAADRVRFSRADASTLRPPFDAPAMIVANPPYGERIALRADQAGDMDLAPFGRCLKEHFGGWTVCLLTSDRELPRTLGMKERRKTPLFNGPIECRLFRFEEFGRAAAGIQ
ncbi:MAG TPA: hypothetical protein PKA20_29545, partial [Burkholderiaceae bacterium]|nr:hypothetical protein [Burkholderiaceae bacterium]